MNAEYEFISEIVCMYDKSLSMLKKSIVMDLNERKKILDQMSKEDHGPWSTIAIKAKKIVADYKKEKRKMYMFLFFSFLALLSYLFVLFFLNF